MSKSIYFDPNESLFLEGNDVLNFSGDNNIFKDLEDYSIAVDLQVKTNDRYSINNSTKDKVFSLISPTKTVGFLSGSEIDGKTRVLTDFFSKIGDYDDKVETIDEALCVSSIDIDFNSWYAASVVINFTDVRGASLFESTEYSHTVDGDPSKNESLFKTFFQFPYPIFLLKIKGFYGDVVTYPLHCSDFKAQFNANNGNFDVTVHFIGYTYAMLNDVQMSYLIAAPYYEGVGKSYWNGQVENGRFRTSDGRPLSTLVELYRKSIDAQTRSEKIDGKELNNRNNKKLLLDNIKGFLDSYIIYLKSLNNYFTVTNNTIQLKVNYNDIESNIRTNLLNKQNDIIKLVNEYQKTYTEEVNVQGLMTINDIENMDFSKNNKQNFDGFYTYYKDITELLNIEIDNINNNINNQKSNISESSLGMKPSLFNYMKTLLAHMETMYHILHTEVSSIDVNRKINGFDINSTDLNKNSDKITPFPWYTKKQNEKGYVDEYIGNDFKETEFKEIEIVKKFVSARISALDTIKKYQKYEENKINESIGSSNIKELSNISNNVWYPISSMDNPINSIGAMKESPYLKLLIEDSGNVEKKLEEIITKRIIKYIATTSSNSEYDKFFSIAEGRNIVDDLNNKPNYLSLTKTVLTNIVMKLEFNKLLIDNNNKPNIESKFMIFEGDSNIDVITNYISSVNDKIKKSKIDSINNIFFNNIIKNNNKLISPKFYKEVKYTQPLLNKISKKKLIYDSNNINSSESSMYFSDKCKFYDPSNDLLIKDKYLGNEIKLGSTGLWGKRSTIFNNNLKYIYQTEELDNSLIFDSKVNGSKPVNDYSYPLIGGELYKYINNNKYKFIFSLFGHPLYYEQGNDKFSNIRKAILFLNSLDINIDLIEETILQDIQEATQEDTPNKPINRLSRISILPKTSLLFIGATLWRFYNSTHDIKPYSGIVIPSRYKYLKNNDNQFIFYDSNDSIKKLEGENLISDDYYRTCSLFKYFTRVDSNTNNNIIDCILTKSESYYFINYFLNWVNGDSWKLIRENLELYLKNGDSIKNGDTFFGKVFSLKNNINEFNIDKLISNYIKIDINDKYYHVDLKNYENNSLLLLNRDNTPVITEILNLLMTQSILVDSGKYVNNVLKDEDVRLRISNISNIIKSELKINDTTSLTTNSTNTTTNNSNLTDKPVGYINSEDLNLSTYTYLKTLYDKWVSGFKTGKEFEWIVPIDDIEVNNNGLPVKNGRDNYIIKNFRFIDRAHNDIGDEILINYKQNLESIDGYGSQKSLYSCITEVLQQQSMIFIPMPSYKYFGSVEDLKEIFKPIPYINSKIDEQQTGIDSSLYLCIYAGRPSSKLNLNGEKSGDSFTFCNKDGSVSDDIPVDCNSEVIDGNSNKIPVIGISYGKQNQSYFKNLSLNMSNPNVTDASINILKNIVNRADQNATQEPISQDLYSLYSKYSYTCDVEMLGCPQIQPMMYFQLNNIPMWNGAYMIYKIKHSIKPGTMTTNFTGMRMDKSYPKLIKDGTISFGLINSELNGITDNFIEVTSPKKMKPLTKNSKDKFNDNDFFKVVDYITDTKGNVKYGGVITEQIYYRLSNVSKIVELIHNEWVNKGFINQYGDFNINCSYREKDENDELGSKDSSAHLLGLAVDIQLKKPEIKENTKVLFDLIVGLMGQGLKLDQVLFEKKSNYLIHIGLAKGISGTFKPDMVNGKYRTRGKIGTMFDGKTVQNEDIILPAIYPQGNEGSSDARNGDYMEKQLSQESINNRTAIKDILKVNNLTKSQVAAILGNIFVESKFKPNAINRKDNGAYDSIGLIQWNMRPEYYGKDKDIIGTTITSQMDYLLTKMPKFTKWKAKTINMSASDAAYEFANLVEVCYQCNKGREIYNNNEDQVMRSIKATYYYSLFNYNNSILMW